MALRRKGVCALAALLAVLCFLSLPAVGHADAGFFSGSADYGGSYSGGSSVSGGGSYSGGGSSFNPVVIFVDDEEQAEDIWNGLILIVAVVVCVTFFVFRTRRKQQSRPRGAQPTIRQSVDPVVLRARDPNFSLPAFLEKAANDYVQMQRCWQEKDWEPMRPLLTGALYAQMERQLEELRRQGRTNYVERIAVLGTRVVEYRQDEVNDILTVEVRARIVDYTLEDVTGALVAGSRTAEKFMTYEWTYIRSKSELTPKPGEKREIHCPNCGAPLSINKSAKCEYCGQVLEAGAYDWALTAIRGISQETRGA